MRTMVQVVCNRLGHETLMAGSIQEGLRMAVEPVDLVLLDVWLPDGNGLEHQAEFAAPARQPRCGGYHRQWRW